MRPVTAKGLKTGYMVIAQYILSQAQEAKTGSVSMRTKGIVWVGQYHLHRTFLPKVPPLLVLLKGPEKAGTFSGVFYLLWSHLPAVQKLFWDVIRLLLLSDAAIPSFSSKPSSSGFHWRDILFSLGPCTDNQLYPPYVDLKGFTSREQLDFQILGMAPWDLQVPIKELTQFEVGISERFSGTDGWQMGGWMVLGITSTAFVALLLV